MILSPNFEQETFFLTFIIKHHNSAILDVEAKSQLPSEEEFAENRCRFEQCALHPSSCFSFRCRMDCTTEESVTSGSCVSVGLSKPQPSPNPCDWYASGCSEKPRHAPHALQPARACLCSAGVALCSHQDKLDLTRGSLLWLMIPPRIFSHSNLVWLNRCANACVWVCVRAQLSDMWRWIKNSHATASKDI